MRWDPALDVDQREVADSNKAREVKVSEANKARYRRPKGTSARPIGTIGPNGVSARVLVDPSSSRYVAAWNVWNVRVYPRRRE